MWTFLDREYDFDRAGFKTLILDIQAGRVDMDAYNKLRDAGRVPMVNPMAFNRGGPDLTGVRWAICHNGGQYAMEVGDNPWKGWDDGWLPPVDPPRPDMGIGDPPAALESV